MLQRVALRAAVGVALASVGGAAYADSISPTTFGATLGIGEIANLNKTVTVSEGPGVRRGDILFMADTTGSMGGTIATVQANFGSIITAITATAGSYAFGAAEYRDLGDGLPVGGGSYRLNAPVTADGGTAAGVGIAAWSAGGGGDTPEQGLFALKTASGAGTGWRSGAEKIIVIAGDASSHADAAPGSPPTPDGTTSVATTSAALNSAGVTVETIDVGSMNAEGQFSGASSIYTAGGVAGTYRTSFGGSLVADILAAIDTAFTTYSNVSLALDPSSGSCVTVGGLGTIASGSFDRSIDRNFGGGVTFTGASEGSCTVTINALVDGAIVAQEVDTFEVTTATPEPASLALISVGLLGLGIGRRRRRS